MTPELAHAHDDGTRSTFLVWAALLALTAVEVVLAYIQVFSTAVMLAVLMVLSLIKAGLIMAWFMHLKFEKRSLVLSLVPAVTIVIALLFVFFPDGFRALELGVQP